MDRCTDSHQYRIGLKTCLDQMIRVVLSVFGKTETFFCQKVDLIRVGIAFCLAETIFQQNADDVFVKFLFHQFIHQCRDFFGCVMGGFCQKSNCQPGSLCIIQCKIAPDTHHIRWSQTAAQDNALVFQTLQVQLIYIRVKSVCCFSQTQWTVFQHSDQCLLFFRVA